jgi:hypothetical protein
VHYSGPSAEGSEVASVEAEVVEGSGPRLLATVLEDGEYTAVATQPSSLKNPSGKSKPISFIVEVQPPTVAEVSSSANRTSAS